ncbi:MAG: BACON domain-containing protein [Acidobacteria bacterium]|nr:BACON domain-containing protein [Acidobacteriota bacterium]
MQRFHQLITNTQFPTTRRWIFTYLLFLSLIALAIGIGCGVSAQQPTVALEAEPQVDDNKTYTGSISAFPISDRTGGINVSFTGDRNNNGYCRYEIATQKDGPFTAAFSFREYLASTPDWRNSFFLGLTPNTKYFIRLTFEDPDGVIGPKSQIAEFTTLASSSAAVSVGTATVTSDRMELSVAIPITDDNNTNSNGNVQVGESATGPWTEKCGSLTNAPSKRCRIRSLVPGKSYWIRTTVTDPDGIAKGNATQIIGPIRYDGLENLAFNKTVSAPPGWGCCSNSQVLTNGRIQAPNWQGGFALPGGDSRYAGGAPGWKSIVIDLGKPTKFNTVSIFYHDAENVPLAWKVSVTDDPRSYKEIFSTNSPMGRTTTQPMPGTWYQPGAFHEARFATTTARYMKYDLDDSTLFSGLHTWLMQIEVYNATDDQYQIYSNPTDPLLYSTSLASGERVETFGNRNAQGVPANITAMNVMDVAGQRTQFILDAQGRPVQIVAFNQTVFQVDWKVPTAPVITATSPDGSIVTYSNSTTYKTQPVLSQTTQAQSEAAINIQSVEALTDSLAKVTLQQCSLPMKDAAVMMIARTSVGDFTLPGKSNGDGSYDNPILLPNRPANASAEELCAGTKKAATSLQSVLGAAVTQLSNQLRAGFGTTTANQVLQAGAESVIKGLQATGKAVNDPGLVCSLSSQPINRFATGVSTFALELFVNGTSQRIFPNVPAIGPFPNEIVNVNTRTACVCQYSLSTYEKTYTAFVTNDSIEVSAPPECYWEATVSGDKDMLKLGVATGKGSGTVRFTVTENSGTTPRTAAIKIADKTFTAKQSGSSCRYTIDPLYESVNSLGGKKEFTIAPTDGCSWSVVSSADWINITSPITSGNTSAKILYTVLPNNTGAERTDAIKAGDQIHTVRQSAICANSVSPIDRRFTADGGTGFVSVNAETACPWVVTDVPDWVKPERVQGQGTGTVSYTVSSNPNPGQRIATIKVGTFSVNITQEGKQTCTVQLAPTSASVSSGVGAGSVSVTAPTACPWTAVSSDTSWLTVVSGNSGNGSSTVRFEVKANPTLTARNAKLTIGGNEFPITQAAGTCTYTLSPSNSSIGSGGTRGTVSVSTSLSVCTWTATSTATWLTIVSGKSGTGNGTVTWEVTPNTSTSVRTGTLTIAGQTFTLTQAGVSCTTSLSPTSANLTSGGSRSSVTVTSNCSWTTSSNDTWLKIISGSSGSGNGSVTYEYGANTSTDFPRYGSLTIGGKTFNVTQATAPCTYSLSPSSASHGSGAGGGSFKVNTNGTGCYWSAYTNDLWLRVTSGSGFGTGSVTFQVSPNSGGSRSGTIYAGGQSFTVYQAGK